MLNLTCGYTLSPSVDTPADIQVTWFVNGAAVDTSLGRIFVDGNTLSFSSLATSDTGNYACKLTVTASQAYVTVLTPITPSAEMGIIVESNSCRDIRLLSKDLM